MSLKTPIQKFRSMKSVYIYIYHDLPKIRILTKLHRSPNRLPMISTNEPRCSERFLHVRLRQGEAEARRALPSALKADPARLKTGNLVEFTPQNMGILWNDIGIIWGMIWGLIIDYMGIIWDNLIYIYIWDLMEFNEHHLVLSRE